MIELDVTTLSPEAAYKLMIGTIVPRPIAWVGTVDSNGKTNLAPFSFFTGVCSNPPTLLFCPTYHSNGAEKDTLRNIKQTQNFTVNSVSETLGAQMNTSSAFYPPDISEFDVTGLTAVPSKKISAPRVGESPASFECELLQIVPIGSGGPGSGHIVIGRIVYAHFSKQVYKDGKIDVNKLQPIARLGGAFYCPVREPFEMKRP